MSVFIDTFEPILPHKKIKWKFIFSKLDSTGFLSRHINHVKESEEKKNRMNGKICRENKIALECVNCYFLYKRGEERREEKK